MEQEEAIKEIANELGIAVRENDFALNRQLLAERINELIVSDFSKLVFILYRLDVNETKLEQLLKINPGKDAGLLLADLVIERQVQKIISRREYNQRDNTIDEEEKW